MTNHSATPEERAKLFDSDLGPEAESIQASLIRVWEFDSQVKPWALLALSWGYQDCHNFYAAAEAKFLWELSLEMWYK